MPGVHIISWRHPILPFVGGLLLGFAFGMWHGRSRNAGSGVVNAETAIAKARAGEPDELIRLANDLGRFPNFRPNRAAVEQAIRHSRSDNVFEQYYGVVTLSKSDPVLSQNAILEFIENGKKKVESETLSNKEWVTLNNALMLAIHSVGANKAAPALIKTNLLEKMAGHDIPMEWGGGAAHQALARQGKAGFDILVRKALEEGGSSPQSFAENAIGKITDPDLVPELEELARDSTKPCKLRFSAVSAIYNIAQTQPKTQSMLAQLFADGDIDLKRMSSGHMQLLGTSEALAALEIASKDPHLDEKFRKELSYMAAVHGPDDAVEQMIDDLMSGNTSKDLKNEILNQLGSGNSIEKLANRPGYQELLSRGLQAMDEKGRPDNRTRSRVWMQLNRLYGQRLPLELRYPINDENDRRLKSESSPIYDMLVRELMNKNLYHVPQCEELALEELKRFVTRYEGADDDDRY